MATICLNMIVKNEAALIRRCLDSVVPHIDSWVIMDTGSSDGTQDLIREHLRALPGELFEGPFTDFGQARTEALARVGDRADYVLFMDADDTLVCPESYALPLLTADAYYLEAWNARPRRAEPLYHLARLFRLRNEYPLALLFAEKAIAVPRPGDMLFLDESVYRWRALDEFAVAAYWNRREQESAQASRALLDSGHLPADEVARVEANLRAARLRLLAA